MKYELFCESCELAFPGESGLYRCPNCHSTLGVVYTDSEIKFNEYHSFPGIFRYFSKLPFSSKKHLISLGEGCTPVTLLKKDADGTEIWIKNETMNPTGTYKDRPACVSVSKAKELGANGVVVASDGNAAPAVAAYAAKGNLSSIVLMPKDTPEMRYIQASAYGAKIVLIDGNINDCLNLAGEIASKIGFHNCCTSNVFNPYQIEGSKTIAFEIFEQMRCLPDWIAVPIGGGSFLSAVVKGFLELKLGGRIKKIPRILAVQAFNCAPFVEAFFTDGVVREFKEYKKTIAITIALPYPPDGVMALKYLKESQGYAIAVTEEEIMEAVLCLSSQYGVLAEPSGAASFAGMTKALLKGIIQPGEVSLAIITGTGLKTIEVFREGINHHIIMCSNDVDSVLRNIN